MDALIAHIDIVKLMEHYNFDNITEDEAYARSSCVLHGGDNPTGFVANVENGRWFCHTGGCGGGDAFTLVQRKEKISFAESVKWLGSFFGVDIGDMDVLRRKSKEEAELKKWLRAIQDRRKLTLQEFLIQEDAKVVKEFRDFKEETLIHFGLKWVDSFDAEKRDGGKYTLRNRLLFPILQDGVYIGASLRRIKSTDIPKWSHQPIKMKTGDLLYNYDATKDADCVVIVEGIPDVWAYYEIGITAVATFGAHLSDEQLKLLLRTGKDIVLSYDGDHAGVSITEKAQRLMRYTTNLSRVNFTESEDPASLTREELMVRYEQRTTF